jgi:hypothetical protein
LVTAARPELVSATRAPPIGTGPAVVISDTAPDKVKVAVVGGDVAVGVGEVGFGVRASHAESRTATPISPASCLEVVPMANTLANLSVFMCAIPPV